MPVPASIRAAAENFRMNSHFVDHAIQDLSPQDWLAQPSDHSNPILWVIGHLIWARSAVLGRLETKWSKPWFPLFARGAKLDDSGQYPPPEQTYETWKESSAMLRRACEEVPEDLLAQPVTPPSPPSADGKISGVIHFMAYHETYHVGQVTYLRTWLGKSRLMG